MSFEKIDANLLCYSFISSETGWILLSCVILIQLIVFFVIFLYLSRLKQNHKQYIDRIAEEKQEELRSMILSIFSEQRQALLIQNERETLSQNEKGEIKISASKYSFPDESFLERSIRIIESHLSKPEFDVQILAKSHGMSKSTYYRKLKRLTGLSPLGFIRHIRLQHAYRMLKDTSYSIAEIAYLVGFSDPKYFTTCFKEEFGVIPSVSRLVSRKNSE